MASSSQPTTKTVKEKQTVYYGTIENVDARTPLTDKTIIDEAYNDKQAEKKKEEEELIKNAYAEMNGALIIFETTKNWRNSIKLQAKERGF
jgi:hypothetical protein